MGVQLSWESTCLASRGSAVRSRLPPPTIQYELYPLSENLMGTQLSWLEHTPDKREVGGSSPLVPTTAYVSMQGKGDLHISNYVDVRVHLFPPQHASANLTDVRYTQYDNYIGDIKQISREYFNIKVQGKLDKELIKENERLIRKKRRKQFTSEISRVKTKLRIRSIRRMRKHLKIKLRRAYR